MLLTLGGRRQKRHTVAYGEDLEEQGPFPQKCADHRYKQSKRLLGQNTVFCFVLNFKLFIATALILIIKQHQIFITKVKFLKIAQIILKCLGGGERF